MRVRRYQEGSAFLARSALKRYAPRRKSTDTLENPSAASRRCETPRIRPFADLAWEQGSFRWCETSLRSCRGIVFSSTAGVGAGVGATKEGKMAPISCKRHQIGHLDFSHSRLLTEGLLVRAILVFSARMRERKKKDLIRCYT